MTFAGKLADSYRETGASDTLVERRTYPSARFPMFDDMIVSKGEVADWELLKDLHYKAGNTPFAPRFWKLTLYDHTIGVMVTGAPKGLLKERHIAFPKLKPGGDETKLTNTHRYKYLNANFRVIARFVVDTMYRGVGVGYRFMNLASRMEGCTFMEIQSSMSKLNYFGQKAGFKYVTPTNSLKFDKGVQFFLENFDASPQDFEGVVTELSSKTGLERIKLIEECRLFYYKNSALERTGSNRHNGRLAIDAMSDRDLIKNIQQMTLASPMYGVFKNPDAGVKLPEKVRLTQFDDQTSNEKLK